MTKVVVKKAMSFAGKQLRPGDVFETQEKLANILRHRGSVDLAPPDPAKGLRTQQSSRRQKVETATPETVSGAAPAASDDGLFTSGATYHRRDMRAED